MAIKETGCKPCDAARRALDAVGLLPRSMRKADSPSPNQLAETPNQRAARLRKEAQGETPP